MPQLRSSEQEDHYRSFFHYPYCAHNVHILLSNNTGAIAVRKLFSPFIAFSELTGMGLVEIYEKVLLRC